MTLDLPRLSPLLRHRAREETCQLLHRIDRMRIEEIRPALVGLGSPEKIAIQINLTVSTRETLRSLSMQVADPKNVDLHRQITVSVFGEREQDALALESQIYVEFVTRILARRHPNGRPLYAASDMMIANLLQPDRGPLNGVRHVAAHSDPDASLTRYFGVLHAWREMEHRKNESHHAHIERLRKRTPSS